MLVCKKLAFKGFGFIWIRIYYFLCDEIAEVCKYRRCNDINCIMHVLNQHKKSNSNSTQKRYQPVKFSTKA